MDGAVDGHIDAGIGPIEEPLDDEQDSLTDRFWYIGRGTETGGEGNRYGINPETGCRPGLSQLPCGIGAPRISEQIVSDCARKG
ncbi:hypothetical protein ACMYR2_3461 [Nitrobacter sp. TKz-YC01]